MTRPMRSKLALNIESVSYDRLITSLASDTGTPYLFIESAYFYSNHDPFPPTTGPEAPCTDPCNVSVSEYVISKIISHGTDADQSLLYRVRWHGIGPIGHTLELTSPLPHSHNFSIPSPPQLTLASTLPSRSASSGVATVSNIFYALTLLCSPPARVPLPGACFPSKPLFL